MTQQDMNLSMAAIPEMTAQVMVAIGRLEEKVDGNSQTLGKLETRLLGKYYKVEERVTILERENQKKDTKIELLEAELETLKKSQPEKMKLGTVITSSLSAVAALMAIVMVFANLSIQEEARREQNIQFEILKENQREINEKVEP